jgi:hypothetical protein
VSLGGRRAWRVRDGERARWLAVAAKTNGLEHAAGRARASLIPRRARSPNERLPENGEQRQSQREQQEEREDGVLIAMRVHRAKLSRGLGLATKSVVEDEAWMVSSTDAVGALARQSQASRPAPRAHESEAG